MNWSHCSRALLVSFVLLTAAVVPATAVSTDKQGVPGEAEVGSEVTATYTFTELYSEYESWTLHGETNLTGVTWTVRKLDQAGNQVDQNSYDGQEVDSAVDISEDTARVVVRVSGTVPAVENFSYDPAEEFTLARFELHRQGGTSQDLAGDDVHHYTEDSKEARDEIDEARTAVEDGGNQQAERDLQNAISAYDDGSFDLAVELANDAEEQANRARSNRDRTQLLLFGGIGVVSLLLVVGGVFYYRSRRETYDKLR